MNKGPEAGVLPGNNAVGTGSYPGPDQCEPKTCDGPQFGNKSELTLSAHHAASSNDDVSDTRGPNAILVEEPAAPTKTTLHPMEDAATGDFKTIEVKKHHTPETIRLKEILGSDFEPWEFHREDLKSPFVYELPEYPCYGNPHAKNGYFPCSIHPFLVYLSEDDEKLLARSAMNAGKTISDVISWLIADRRGRDAETRAKRSGDILNEAHNQAKGGLPHE